MSTRKTARAIGLLKAAAKAPNPSKAYHLGKEIAQHAKDLYHAGKATWDTAGELGAGAAHHLGAPEGLGKAVGKAGVIAAGVGTADYAKRKADEYRYRLLYGNQFY